MIRSDVIHQPPVTNDEGSLVDPEVAQSVRCWFDQLRQATAVRLHLKALVVMLERRRRADAMAA